MTIFNVLDKGLVAVIAGGDTFHGLITRTDVLELSSPAASVKEYAKTTGFGTRAIHAGQTA